MVDRGTLARAPGTNSGRVVPSSWLAPDGTRVFLLGSEQARSGFFNLGDYTQITQAPGGVQNAVRFRAKLVGPRAALPAGWSWALVTTADGFVGTYQSIPLARGLDAVHDDLAISLRGVAVPTIGFRLAVVGPGVGPYDPVELPIPAVYLDSVVSDVSSAPYIANRFPTDGQTAVDDATSITFDAIVPDAGSIDVTGTTVTVNGQPAYGPAGFAAGWSGSISTPATGVARFTMTPAVPFASQSTVSVIVRALDTAALEVSSAWSFVIEDLTAPRMLTASALDATTVRVLFDEAVDIFNAEWSFERLSAPSVMPDVVSYDAVTSTMVDVVTSIPLTRGATYAISVTGVRDEAGNLIVAPNHRATFVAYEPPADARRRFDLWWMLPRLNRDEDAGTRDLYKTIAILQEVVDLLLADVDRWTEILDVDIAADRYLDQMLIGLGNPFAFDLSTNDKRRLIRVLVRMYQQKGTAIGIINAIRFFVGVEVTIAAYNDEGWILGEDELGVDTLLAPSSSFARYSFDVISPAVLADTQRSQIASIVDYLKPAHTHHIQTTEPTPPTVIDHVELGLSGLGDDFYLHN